MRQESLAVGAIIENIDEDEALECGRREADLIFK